MKGKTTNRLGENQEDFILPIRPKFLDFFPSPISPDQAFPPPSLRKGRKSPIFQWDPLLSIFIIFFYRFDKGRKGKKSKNLFFIPQIKRLLEKMSSIFPSSP